MSLVPFRRFSPSEVVLEKLCTESLTHLITVARRRAGATERREALFLLTVYRFIHLSRSGAIYLTPVRKQGQEYGVGRCRVNTPKPAWELLFPAGLTSGIHRLTRIPLSQSSGDLVVSRNFLLWSAQRCALDLLGVS